MASSGSTAVPMRAALALARPRRVPPVRAMIRLAWLALVGLMLYGGGPVWMLPPALAAERTTLRIQVELNPARTPGAVLTLSGGKLLAASSPRKNEGDGDADLVVETKRNRVRLSRTTPRSRDVVDLVLEPTSDSVLRMDWHTSEAQRDAETVELSLKDVERGERQIRLPGHGLRLTIRSMGSGSEEQLEVSDGAGSESPIQQTGAKMTEPRLELRVNRDHLVFAPRQPLLIEAELLDGELNHDTAETLSVQWRLLQPGTGKVISYDYEPLGREGRQWITHLSLPLPFHEGLVEGDVSVVREGGEALATSRFRCLVLSPGRTPEAQSEVGPLAPDDSRSGLIFRRARPGETGRIERAVSRVLGRKEEESPPVLTWRGLSPQRPYRLDLGPTSQRQSLAWTDAAESGGLSWPAHPLPASLLLWPSSSELQLAFAHAPSAFSLLQPAIELPDLPPVGSRWWGSRVENPAEIEELASPVPATEAPEVTWLRAVDRCLESLLVRGENCLLVHVTHPETPLVSLTDHPETTMPVLRARPALDQKQAIERLPIDRLEILLRRATSADIAVIPLLSQPRTAGPAGLPAAVAEPVLKALHSRYSEHPSLAGIALRLDGDSPWEFRARDEGWSQLAPEFARTRTPDPARPNRPQVSWQDPAWLEWRAQAAQGAWQQLAQRMTRTWPAGRLVLDIRSAVPNQEEARDAVALRHRFDPLQARGVAPRGTPPTGRPTLMYLLDAATWQEVRHDPQTAPAAGLLGWSESPPHTGEPLSGDGARFRSLALTRTPDDEVRGWLAQIAGDAVFSSQSIRFVRRDAGWQNLHEVFTGLPLSAPPADAVAFGNDAVLVRAIATDDLLFLWSINSTGLSAEIDLTIEGVPQSQATEIVRGGSGPMGCPSRPGSRLQTTLSLAPGQIWRATLITSTARLTAARVRRPSGEIARLSRRIEAITARLAELEQVNRQQPGERFASGFEANAGETLGWEPATRTAPWSLDRTVSRDGQQAVTLASAESEIVSRELSLSRAPQIEVTAWLKAQRADFPAEIVAETTRGDAAWQDQRKLSTSTNWERKSVVFTLPETARGQPLRVRIRGRAAGRLWVDDVVIQSDTEASGEYRTLTRALAAANLAWKDGRYSDCDRLLGEWTGGPSAPPRGSRTSDRNWLTPWRR